MNTPPISKVKYEIYLESRSRITTKVSGRFKVTISQVRKLADKNSSKQLLRMKLA